MERMAIASSALRIASSKSTWMRASACACWLRVSNSIVFVLARSDSSMATMSE